MNLEKVFLILETFLYAGFFYSATFYFKKEKNGFNVLQFLIQVLGAIVIIRSLLLNYSLGFDFSHNRVIVAFVCLLYALGLFYWAFYTVRSVSLMFAHSESKPTQIIRQGPYAHVRHPFYGAYTFAWISSTLTTADPIIGMCSLCLIALYIRAAKKEEREFAASIVGSNYMEYKSHTKMFIPKIF